MIDMIMTECCNVGECAHQISMPINGRVEFIDYCISDIVAALNAAGIATCASCCGHGTQEGGAMLNDGRILRIENVKKGGRNRSHLIQRRHVGII